MKSFINQHHFLICIMWTRSLQMVWIFELRNMQVGRQHFLFSSCQEKFYSFRGHLPKHVTVKHINNMISNNNILPLKHFHVYEIPCTSGDCSHLCAEFSSHWSWYKLGRSDGINLLIVEMFILCIPELKRSGPAKSI